MLGFLGVKSQQYPQNTKFFEAFDVNTGATLWKTLVADSIIYYYNSRLLEDRIMLFYVKYKADGYYYALTHLDYDGNIIGEYEHKYDENFMYYSDYNFIGESGNIILGIRWGGYDIAKLNMVGDTVWTYEIPFQNTTAIRQSVSVIEDALGNIYCTGDGQLLLTDTACDMITTKLDSDGNVVWQHVSGSEPNTLDTNDYGHLVATNLEYVAAAGVRAVMVEDSIQYKGIIHIYHPDSGEPIYSLTVSDTFSLSIFFESLEFYKHKLYYQLAINPSAAPDDNSLITGCILLPKVNGVGDIPSVSGVLTFPNPTSGKVSLSGLSPQDVQEARVIDVSGHILAKLPITQSEMEIPLDNYPSGAYILSLVGKKYTLNKKIIKE